jgi:hypothetical protein
MPQGNQLDPNQEGPFAQHAPTSRARRLCKQCASMNKNGYEWKAAETTQRQAKKGPGDKKLQTNIQPRVDDREAQR